MSRKKRIEGPPDLDPRRTYRRNQVIVAINRLGKTQDSCFPGLPCKKGCSNCCHEDVLVTQAEAQIVLNILTRKLPQSIVHQVVKNARGRKGKCPFLTREIRGCALHKKGGKPLICRLAGRATWPANGRTQKGSGRTTVGCNAVNNWWQRQESNLLRNEDNDAYLLPLGIGIHAVIMMMTKRDSPGDLRQIVLANLNYFK